MKEAVRENVHKVTFFGTKNEAVVNANKIVAFSNENCEKYNKPSQTKTKAFKEAVAALEELKAINKKIFANLETQENVPPETDLKEDEEEPAEQIQESASIRSNIRKVKRELDETLPAKFVNIQDGNNPHQADLLRTQFILIESSFNVRNNLRLEKSQVNMDEALENLQEIQRVLPESTRIMICKYPDILWTQQKLCNYKGNIENWKMSKKELEKTLTKTELIKEIAKRNVDIIQVGLLVF